MIRDWWDAVCSGWRAGLKQYRNRRTFLRNRAKVEKVLDEAEAAERERQEHKA